MYKYKYKIPFSCWKEVSQTAAPLHLYMTEHHNFLQGVGALRGGRNENHFNRILTSPQNRISGAQSPILQTFAIVMQQQQEGAKAPNASPLSPIVSSAWQKEPADDKLADMEQFIPIKKEKMDSDNMDLDTIESIDPIIFDSEEEEQYDDFCLYRNVDNFYSIAPLTPQSLSNSPSMPAEPHLIPLDSFDSDEEYDTTGFFPSLSSIERRPPLEMENEEEE